VIADRVAVGERCGRTEPAILFTRSPQLDHLSRPLQN
jgi:hypothetical protein